MLKKILWTAVALGLSTSAVQANEVSAYITASMGWAKADKPKHAKEIHSWYREEDGGSTSTDRTDTAYKIAVGIQANSYVALELQYIDLGENSYKFRELGSDGADFWEENGTLKSATSGFGANVVGNYPMGDFSLFAKAGYHYLKTESSLRFSDVGNFYVPEYVSDNKTIRKWTPSFGVGASYNVTQNFSIVAEYELYKGVADKKVTILDQSHSFKHDIELASVGLRYNF